MTAQQAECRYQYHLLQRRKAVDSARDELAVAERLVEHYEKNKEHYIAHFKSLPWVP